MTTFHDHYPDILDEQADPELERLVTRLDAIGRRFSQTPMPATRNARITSALREHALASRRPGSRALRLRGAWSARRIATLSVAALTAIAVLTGATLTFVVPLSPWNFGVLQQTGQFPQVQDINITSSEHGYTLKLSQVYADANVFIVGYSATAPSGKTVEVGFKSPEVTDASGDVLPELDYGGVAHFDGAPGSLQYQSFDTGSVSGLPSALQLHMVVPALALPQAAPGKPAASPTPGAAPSGDTPVAPGPFVFDLTVTYHGGRELRPRQAVTQHGRTITLERVVSTPLETRFYVSGDAMNSYPTLNVGGHTLDAATWGPDGDVSVYRFSGSPYTDHGAWTLAIHARDTVGGVQPGEQPLPPGVWSFTFTLP